MTSQTQVCVSLSLSVSVCLCVCVWVSLQMWSRSRSQNQGDVSFSVSLLELYYKVFCIFCLGSRKGRLVHFTFLNQTDNAGVKTLLYTSDLQLPKPQFYSSLKHRLASRFTDQNIKKCNHIQDENCLCDKSNSPYFIDVQKLPTNSVYFPYEFEDNLTKENECF